MRVSQTGISFLQAREGVELTAYNKDGKWTIGYGNTYYENGTAVKKGDTITLERAKSLFTIILKEYETGVTNALTAKVSQSNFDALVSIAYNIGMTAFRNSTLLKLVNKNPSDSAIRNEFAKWVYSQGKVLNGLVTRRRLEADLYFSSSVSPTNTTNIITGLVLLLIVLLIFNHKKVLQIWKQMKFPHQNSGFLTEKCHLMRQTQIIY